jgi:uncharacterized alkaline shock family protein YloU
MYDKLKQIDAKEIDLPKTTFIRDIETKVFQGIVLQALSRVEGIGLLENTLFDSLLGRDLERLKGIHVEQDNKKQSVIIRIEVDIAYGLSIPEKAEEIQQIVVQEVSRFTGLHVSSVHVIFKHLILPQELESQKEKQEEFEETETGEYEKEF